MSLAATTTLLTPAMLGPVLSVLAKAAEGPVGRALANWQASAKLKGIARTLSRLETVRTLWSPDKEINLHTFYYPSRIRESQLLTNDLGETEGKSDRVIDSLSDLPSGRLIIEGIVGQGKSIFLRFLASKAVRDGNNPRLPIFIELRTLTHRLSLKQAIHRFLDSIDVKSDVEVFSYLANSGKVMLLLDAFDELAEDLVTDVLSDLDLLSTKYPDLQIVVTSRPGNEIQKTVGFRTVELCPLRQGDFPVFLQRLGLNATKRADILRAIERSPSGVEGIIRTPLMLTLVVIVYESEREIPPTLPDFFERLFQVVFTRHDRLKAGFNRKHHSGLSERRLQILFEAFCFMVLRAGLGRTLRIDQFNKAFDSALEYTQGCQCDAEKFRLDITKVACLMLEEGIDLVTFLHKSILEYYAAAFIAHSTEDVAKRFYSHALENLRPWEAVVTYLQEIDPFRFAKYYTLVDAGATLRLVSGVLDANDARSLLRFIESTQPGLCLAFRKEDLQRETRLRSFAYGPITEPRTLSQARIPDHLVRAMDALLARATTESDLQSITFVHADGASLTGLEDETLVPHHLLVQHFGADEFFRVLGSFRLELERKLENARNVIALEERRTLLFDNLELKREPLAGPF